MKTSIAFSMLNVSNYGLNQFTEDEINAVDKMIECKNPKGPDEKKTFFIKCQISKKSKKITPEEIIKQLYLYKLTHKYNYPIEKIKIDYKASSNANKIDIVVFENDQKPDKETNKSDKNNDSPFMVVVVKKPTAIEGKKLLKDFCKKSKSPIGIYTNGKIISHYHNREDGLFEDISGIAKFNKEHEDWNEELNKVINKPLTIVDLKEENKFIKEGKTLLAVVSELETEVLLKSDCNVFAEFFKLLLTKFYDETESLKNPKRNLKFVKTNENGKTTSENDKITSENIKTLFKEAKKEFKFIFDEPIETGQGIFMKNSKIKLTPTELSICVSSLQNVKLFNSNPKDIESTFEELINRYDKTKRDLYFTPRYIIDMCIKMLNLKEKDFLLDPACGSGGFLTRTLDKFWNDFIEISNLETGRFTYFNTIPANLSSYANKKIFGFDLDQKALKIAQFLNLIECNPEINLFNLDSLDYENWPDNKLPGFKNLAKLRNSTIPDSTPNKNYEFDVIMTNPPFSRKIKDEKILEQYRHTNKKGNDELRSTVTQDLLFIERSFDLLKPGGRMAIILPQGVFNNTTDQYIRKYIVEKSRILAVVGLNENIFKPMSGVKSSVLFVQKWEEREEQKPDYPIFFATMQEPSKNSTGVELYYPDYKDKNGFPIIKHDLYIQNGINKEGKEETVNEIGIAEAFIEFAKKENLSFF